MPDRPGPAAARGVDRVLLCSGKIYHDWWPSGPPPRTRRPRSSGSSSSTRWTRRRCRRRSPGTPTPAVWVQDEPANQGAWPFMVLALPPMLAGRTLVRVSRPASASPAAGSARKAPGRAAGAPRPGIQPLSAAVFSFRAARNLNTAARSGSRVPRRPARAVRDNVRMYFTDGASRSWPSSRRGAGVAGVAGRAAAATSWNLNPDFEVRSSGWPPGSPGSTTRTTNDRGGADLRRRGRAGGRVGDPKALGWVGRVAARTPQEEYPISVFGLGIPGESTADLAARWWEESRRRFGPDGEASCRLALGLGIDDAVQGLSIPRSRLNLANILDDAHSRRLPPSWSARRRALCPPTTTGWKSCPARSATSAAAVTSRSWTPSSAAHARGLAHRPRLRRRRCSPPGRLRPARLAVLHGAVRVAGRPRALTRVRALRAW